MRRLRIVAMGMLVLLSAGRAQAQPQAAAKATAPMIAATPNPVPFGAGPGAVTITWSTGDGSDGRVQVSTNGGLEQIFGKGPTGSATAPWITANSTFVFRLYSVGDAKKVLASVKVTRQPPPIVPTIEATPNPVPVGEGPGTTTLTWTTGNGTDGEIFVSTNGSPDRIFTKGPSGSTAVNWIDRTATYVFSLYTPDTPRKRLASVTMNPSMAAAAGTASAALPVQVAVPTVSAVLVAHPNPVSAGFGAGSTQIAWDVGDGTTGRVVVSVNGLPPKEFAVGPKGARDAPWILAGSVYEFRLYSGDASNALLASMIVTRRDPYEMLFWLTLAVLVAVASAFLWRLRRSR